MKLLFDERGHLKPYRKIEATQEVFEYVFVTSYQKDSTRHKIFDQYKTYLDDLKEIITGDFIQWINGSFVTQKYNPKDIDLVTIIEHKEFSEKSELLRKKFLGYNARNFYGVDAYAVVNFPETHTKYSFTKSDLLYWSNLFSQTKVNRARKQFSKGFIQISFTHHITHYG